MTLKRICEIQNNQLIINLPKGFEDKKKVMVIVYDREYIGLDAKTQKLEMLKQYTTIHLNGKCLSSKITTSC